MMNLPLNMVIGFMPAIAGGQLHHKPAKDELVLRKIMENAP
ncbi:hypothetical protein [Methylobacillus methanolivorans]